VLHVGYGGCPCCQSLASFRSERERDWKAFEGLITRAEKHSPGALTDEELLSLPVLYRSTLSALSVARATSLDNALIAYLEALCLRGYFYLYGARRGLIERIADFFVHDWPGAIRDLWRETLASVALMVIGFVAGFRLVASDKAWYDVIIPGDLAGGRGPDATVEWLRQGLYDGGDGYLSTFAAYLFTHNVQVSILAFALGFALAVPTVLLVLMNGCLLGAMFYVFRSKGLAYEFGGWLFIHGSTELFAICIAGAAGMRIGTRIAFPGALSRMKAAAKAGRGARTLGKRIMGLRVASRDGSGLAIDQVIARNLMREIEVFLPLSMLLARADGDALTTVFGLAWTMVFALFPLLNRDRMRIGDLLAGTWVIETPKRTLAEDLAQRSDPTTRAFRFTPAQLDVYGIAELHKLEEILRGDNDAALNTVAGTIGDKIGVRHGHQRARLFLTAYYDELRAHLERKLLLGKRRINKHDA
jgi:uncharacterized membrane protein SpoIIM required for sporulation